MEVVPALLFLLVFLAPPAFLKACDYTYVTNNRSITITEYAGTSLTPFVPDTIDGLPVTAIGTHPDPFYGAIGAFQWTPVLMVTLGTNITSIGDRAFCGCDSLTSMNIPNTVTSIGDWAFASCPIGTIIIPDSVTNIGSYAFNECPVLSKVVIGRGANTIGYRAFAGVDNQIIYFTGNLPAHVDPDVFTTYYYGGPPPVVWPVTVFYLPGTSNWGPTLGRRPTILWNPQITHMNFTVSGKFKLSADSTNNWGKVALMACTNLANPIWSEIWISEMYPSQAATFHADFWDDQWTNYPARFYRLGWP
jgi:hypothetical protein